MVEFVSVSECKSNFGRLLDRVRLGDRFIITENGIPIAELRPAQSTEATRMQIGEKRQQPAEPQSPV